MNWRHWVFGAWAVLFLRFVWWPRVRALRVIEAAERGRWDRAVARVGELRDRLEAAEATVRVHGFTIRQLSTQRDALLELLGRQ